MFEPVFESATTFSKFMSSIFVKEPALSLTPDGHIYCSWKDDDKRFSVHFKSDDTLTFSYIEKDKNNTFIDCILQDLLTFLEGNREKFYFVVRNENKPDLW